MKTKLLVKLKNQNSILLKKKTSSSLVRGGGVVQSLTATIPPNPPSLFSLQIGKIEF